jgi:hypothetical protein
MPRPGVTTQVLDDFVPAGPALNTGTGMIVGDTQRGPVNTPIKVQSFRQYKDTFGTLAGGPDMYKAAYTFFQEGGLYLWVVRASNAEVFATAQVTNWMDLTANGPGAWANADVSGDVGLVTHLVPTGEGGEDDSFTWTVDLNGSPVEVSTPLAADAVHLWKSKYITIALQDDAPQYAVAPVHSYFGGGEDPTEAPSTQVLGAALDTLRYDLGPAQVGLPGNTDPDAHALLDEHCTKYHRVAVADLPDTPEPAVLFGAVQHTSDLPGKGRQILSLGTRVEYPGETQPSVWDVPYSGIQMGIIARVDGLNDPSQVAAGSLGYSRLAIGPKVDFTDDEREQLNYAGVTLGKVINGQFRTYGYRTTAGLRETNWVFFQESRVVMAVAHECDAIMEEFTFKTIDGRGKIFGRVEVALTGVCQRYWAADALFGETPNEGFRVDASYPGQNTVETIARGEIHAQVLLRTSRVAEWIALDIVKVPLERAIA